MVVSKCTSKRVFYLKVLDFFAPQGTTSPSKPYIAYHADNAFYELLADGRWLEVSCAN